MAYDAFDAAKLVLGDGTELRGWSDYSVNADFLTPSDGWSLSLGGEDVWDKVKELLKPEKSVQLLVGDALQLTGWIDRVTTKSQRGGGLLIQIEGRDILKPLIKATIHPDVPYKKLTLGGLVDAVVKRYYRDPPAVVWDNEANRNLVTGAGGRLKGKGKSNKKSTEIDWVHPHPGESAFDFLGRNCRRFGVWPWAAADGTIVVSSPAYDQEPAYQIVRKRGMSTVSVTDASYTWDRTNTPSTIFVRGKGTQKEFEKRTVQAQASDPDWDNSAPYIEPVFVVHDQAETNDQAAAFAAQELTKAKERERVYQCTCIGHRDKVTGNVYGLDTIAAVDDELLGVHESMYVCTRTFRRSRAGTVTELTMVPLGAIKFSDADAPS